MHYRRYLEFVLDRGVERKVDEYTKRYPKFDLAFRRLEWILVKDPELSMYQEENPKLVNIYKNNQGNTQFLLRQEAYQLEEASELEEEYKQKRANKIEKPPTIVLLCSFDEIRVTVHDIRVPESESL